MFVSEKSDTDINICSIKRIIQNLDGSVEDLIQKGNSIPCVKKNAKQLKALVEILKIECMDV